MKRRDETMTPERAGRCEPADARRALPPVNRLADLVGDRVADLGWADRVGRERIVEAARTVIEQRRAAIAASDGAPHDSDDGDDEALLVRRVVCALERDLRPVLGPAINATGIILHTGLGRAPLSKPAATALFEAARRYAPVELDLDSGRRGDRSAIVCDWLRRLTGCESALVVNNNAAALVLVMAALARGRSVVVSRGELVEIGGSFRLPDVIGAAGAGLREVGTTNRTRPTDYAAAIDDQTALLLKVHPSNFRVQGFTASVSVADLSAIATRHGLPLVHDIGSGMLNRAIVRLLPVDEPDAQSSLEAGADLVLFSGDKLLGGPQCGIIVGRGDLIDRLARHPMMRALRVDKLTLAALGATLQVLLDPERARETIPAIRMSRPDADLSARARRLAEQLAGLDGVAEAVAGPTEAYLGGGSSPAQAIASVGVHLRARDLSEDDLGRSLRLGDPPVVARIQNGRVVLDLRTVFEDQDERVVEVVRAAIRPVEPGPLSR